MAQPAAASGTDGRWLSLGPASRLLGVDPDTLRRWADTGRVGSWTTPGGHRRFDQHVLERLARDRRTTGQARPLADLGASPERLNRVYRQRYAAGLRDEIHGATPPGDVERASYREDGRRLIAALTAYLDADAADVATRAATEAAATALVEDHGARSAAGGISLTEAVGLFVTSRGPFLDEIAGLGRRRALDPARLAALYGDASAILDRLLLRFIAAHQRAG